MFLDAMCAIYPILWGAHLCQIICCIERHILLHIRRYMGICWTLAPHIAYAACAESCNSPMYRGYSILIYILPCILLASKALLYVLFSNITSYRVVLIVTLVVVVVVAS